MEQKFIRAWAAARAQAEALGIRMRPIADADALKTAHHILASRRLSDGFNQLKEQNRLDLTLEALVIHRHYTLLFSDQEANEALIRLLEAGYKF